MAVRDWRRSIKSTVTFKLVSKDHNREGLQNLRIKLPIKMLMQGRSSGFIHRDSMTHFPKLYTPEGYTDEFLIYENLLFPSLAGENDTFNGRKTELTRTKFFSEPNRKGRMGKIETNHRNSA